MPEEPKQRRPSRFEVTTEGGNTFVPAASADDESKDASRSSLEDRFGLASPLPHDSPAARALQQLSSQPKKSILKKSNSHTIHAFPSDGRGMRGSPSSPAVGELARNMAKAIEESRYATFYFCFVSIYMTFMS